MKKIKLLFGIGLLGVLFSTCFGANVTNSLSVFRNIGNSSPAVLASSLIRSENAVLFGNPGNYYFTGGNRTTLSAISSLSGGAFVSHSGIFSNLSTARFMQYDLAIQDGYNFSITGYYLDTSGNWLPLSVYNNTFSDIYGTFQVNYNIYEDFFPFAFKIGEGYFTLTDTTAIYNGIPYGITQYGTIQQCFYGLNYSFSCIYTDSNDNYNFVHYFYDTQRETAFELSGFVVIPLNEMTSYYNGTDNGSKTLILSFDSQNRIIYNIIDVFSDDINYLKSSNIIDRGYFDLSSLAFVKRYLLNSNSLSLGTTSEIFYDSGSYYYRSNIIKNTSTASSSYYNYCSSDVNRCFSKTGINLLFDSSVIDILNSSDSSQGGGSQQTYSGSVVLNNCVETQVCYDITGDNEEVIRVCTTKCIDTGSIVSGSFVGSDGTIYYVDSPVDFSISSDGLVYDTGYLDSDGILSIDYYSGLFNGDSSFKLGVCPYPASNLLSFATKIKLGNFYPFMPLNCFISAFQQGAKVHFFDDFGLFPDLDSQLINGDTNFHITLYRFFDFLLSIGLLFVLSALHRLLVK